LILNILREHLQIGAIGRVRRVTDRRDRRVLAGTFDAAGGAGDGLLTRFGVVRFEVAPALGECLRVAGDRFKIPPFWASKACLIGVMISLTTATSRSASASSVSVTLPSMLFSMGTTPRSKLSSATASMMAVTDSRKETSSATALAARCE